MPVSLTQPDEDSVGWAAAVNQNFQDIQDALNAGAAGGSELGSIVLWHSTTPPAGWLLCDGAAVSRTTYFDLFGVVGTAWGPGDGSTTFNLPNFSGRSPMGVDSGGSGQIPTAVGQATGESTHTMTLSELVAHTHDTLLFTGGGVSGSGVGAYDNSFGKITSSTGSSTPFNVVHPVRGTYFVIRYQSATTQVEFDDSLFRVYDDGDPSKLLALELSGIATGTTRTLTVPDASGTIALTSNLVFPTRHMQGLAIRYAGTNLFTVSPGEARDKLDTGDMELTSTVTVDVTTAGALGYERKSMGGTATFTNTSDAVAGVGTTFFSDFGKRQVVGVTVTSASTIMTPTGSIEGLVNWGDLVGNDAKGYYRVANFGVSGATITLTVAPGVAFAGEDLYVIEQPLIESAGGRVHAVRYITSDTALVVTTAATLTEAGVAIYASSKGLNPSDGVVSWRYVWLLSGSSGSTVVTSSQRTTPFLSSSGYQAHYRKIGAFRVNGAGNMNAVDTFNTDGHRRRFFHRQAIASLVNASSPITTPTQFFGAGSGTPPGADAAYCLLWSDSPNTVSTVTVQRRGRGTAGVSQANSGLAIAVTAPSTSGRADVQGWVAVDRFTGMEHYGVATTGDGTSMNVTGWEEELE